VLLSSIEAECIALTDAAKEAMWLKMFFEEIQRPLSTPLALVGDNQGVAILRSWATGAQGLKMGMWHY
jgi:hypothetical protein